MSRPAFLIMADIDVLGIEALHVVASLRRGDRDAPALADAVLTRWSQLGAELAHGDTARTTDAAQAGGSSGRAVTRAARAARATRTTRTAE